MNFKYPFSFILATVSATVVYAKGSNQAIQLEYVPLPESVIVQVKDSWK